MLSSLELNMIEEGNKHLHFTQQSSTMTWNIHNAHMLIARDVIVSTLIKKTQTKGGWAGRQSKQHSYSSAVTAAAWSRKEPQGRKRSWQLTQIVWSVSHHWCLFGSADGQLVWYNLLDLTWYFITCQNTLISVGSKCIKTFNVINFKIKWEIFIFLILMHL